MDSDKEYKRTKRRLKIFYTFFFSIVLGIPLGGFSYYQYQLYSLEKQTLNHLYQIGYVDSDIRKMETRYLYGSRFTAQVVFVDEPEIFYEFIKRKGELIPLDPQGGEDGYEYKHWDRIDK